MQARIGHTALTWDVLAQPALLATAIDDCAALGFQGIETGGRVYDWWEEQRPGELSRRLADARLPMVCLFHYGDWTDPAAAPALLADARRWAAAVKALGGEMLMLVPGPRAGDEPTSQAAIDQMAATMNQAGAIAREAGIAAAMHPHWGTAAETRDEIDRLLAALDPSLVGFAPDSGQIAKGGADPVAVFQAWAPRIQYVHLKDLSPDWEAMKQRGEPLRSPAGYAAPGTGVLDLAGVLSVLAGAGYQGWVMAELDEASYPAATAAREARDFFQAQGCWPAADAGA